MNRFMKSDEKLLDINESLEEDNPFSTSRMVNVDLDESSKVMEESLPTFHEINMANLGSAATDPKMTSLEHMRLLTQEDSSDSDKFLDDNT